MKIPKSVRDLYRDIQPKYLNLKEHVDALVGSRKERRWHYESRVKEEESFALKLETGRVKDVEAPEDLFGCTLVVENTAKIEMAENLVLELFTKDYRRPKDPKLTHLDPMNFDFDDLRLYVRWKDDPKARPTGLDGSLFEVQIKTFLQHAWGIATHDFIYKSEAVEWSTSRIAFQVRAMLENAELTISEAKNLTGSAVLDRCNYHLRDCQKAVDDLKKRWTTEHLPTDLRRLADNVLSLSYKLDIAMDAIWKAVDEATVAGEGALTLNLSPYATILSALVRKMGADAFSPLGNSRSKDVFVPREVSLPDLSERIKQKIIQPPAV